MAETLNPIPFCRCCHKNGDFKCLFSDFIYENEIENYSQMLYDTFGILFVPSIDDKIYTICDECIEKLRISTEFKNCVLACKKNACWRGHCRARLDGGTAVTPHMKQETSEDEDSDTAIINKVSDEESNQEVKVEESGNKSDEIYSESEEPLIAFDIDVKIEEIAYEEGSVINKVSDKECNQEVKVEESGNKSDETSSESEGALIADDIKVEREEMVNDEDSVINKVLDEESNEESEMKSDETLKDAGVSLRKSSDIHEYKCNICNKTFKRKGNLENHFRTHGGSKRQTNKRENTKYIAKHHQLKVHMDRQTHDCQECGRRFTQKGSLLRHCREVHMGAKKYSCRYCDKKIATKQNLIIHERIHTGVKPYVCEICDKPFHSKEGLLNHNVVHLTRKSFTCNVCDKAYQRKETFKMHMLTHTGIKSFQCCVCSKSFALKGYLNKHVKTHNDEIYKCDVCKKTFKYKRNLSQHMSVEHLGFKLDCDICKKTFKSKRNIRNHMLAVHLGFKLDCDICKKTFKYKKSLSKHMSVVHGL